MEFITIQRITSFDEQLLTDMSRLLSQWYGKEYHIDTAWLTLVINHSYLLGLYDGNSLVGMVTLMELYKMSGYKGSVEHLMIDEKYRGHKLGEKLMVHVVNLAKSLQMKNIYLTCDVENMIANSLYQKLGFVKEKTHFYHLDLNLHE